jgi:hypothetical protein
MEGTIQTVTKEKEKLAAETQVNYIFWIELLLHNTNILSTCKYNTNI